MTDKVYRKVYITCPYCDFSNKVAVDGIRTDEGLHYCDVELGGCGKQFAYRVQWMPAVQTSEVKFGSSSPVFNSL